MDQARRQYFKDIFFTQPKEKIPWDKQEKFCTDLTAVLDEFDQEASLEDIHAIFSIPENTYDAETLKTAVSETVSSGHILLALYGTLSGLGVEETNLSKLDVGKFWGYGGKYAHAYGKSGPLPRSLGKMTNITDVDLCIEHYGTSVVTRIPKEICNWTKLQTFRFVGYSFDRYAEVSWTDCVEAWSDLKGVYISGHWMESKDDYQYMIDEARRLRPDCTGWVSIPSD